MFPINRRWLLRDRKTHLSFDRIFIWECEVRFLTAGLQTETFAIKYELAQLTEEPAHIPDTVSHLRNIIDLFLGFHPDK